jgi:PKD repeat protein
MNSKTLVLAALVALGCLPAAAQTSTLSSVAIDTAVTAGGLANGVATVTPRIGTALNQPGSVGDVLAGLQYVPGAIPLDGAPSSIAFFTLSGAAIPGGAGNPATAFTSFGTLTSPTAVTTYSDPASKLTANSYSALTFAEADLGAGSRDFYMIHHKTGTDYFAQIVPGTGVATLIRDLKPMSWTGPTAGGPANVGTTGYFGLAWATGILSAGAPYLDQSLYYLRTDSSVPGHTKFGVMIPALTGGSSDTLDLTTAVGSFGVGGYSTLAFSGTVLSNYGANQFYYLRQDNAAGGTGNTILGRINPSLVAGTRTVSDIANLGGVFTTLNFAPDATGPAGAWGSTQFYITGALAAGSQSVSFEAIPNHNVGDVFTITPTASSGLDLTVTVVSGPATVATTGVSGATPLSLRVFTVTTTGAGIVTLRATQGGRAAPLPAYSVNFLQQSFNVLGLPVITGPTTAPATAGVPFAFTIGATGSPTSFTASPLPAGVTFSTATGVFGGTPSAAGTTVVSLTATNATGTSSPTTLTLTVAPAGVAPIITGPTSAPATAGAAFVTYTIAATGSPTSYGAAGLPAGLTVNPVTGAINGTPTAAGVSIATISATNGVGTGTATLTITVAPAATAPIITSSTTAPATAGTPFVTYVIAATGLPTSFTATGLPAGLALNSVTGAITGTPTTAGTSVATISATNALGTGTATLTITVAAAVAAPIIVSPITAPATAGTPFVTYVIAATGLPTTFTATGLPPGLTLNPLTGAINGTPTASGTFVVALAATNSTGTGLSTLTITVAAAAVAPIITSPATAPATAGAPFVTYVIAGTGLPTSFTATGLPPGLTLNPLTGAINGTPTTAGTFAVTITATNSTGTSTSVLSIVVAATPGSRITNFSALGLSGSGIQTVTIGFMVSSGSKTILMRAVGPTLSTFGVQNALADPTLTLYGPGVIATDDNWETSSVGLAVGPAMSAAFASAGAFALPHLSLDSSLLFTAVNGVPNTGILGVNGAAGVALLEIYDADGNPATRLTNVSARMNVAPGSGAFTAGLIITGTVPKTVLIRGVGPTLSVFGVAGALADPLLTVYSGSTVIASDDNWETGASTAAQITAADTQVSAFALPPGGKDSALILTLAPGAYTMQVTGVGGATGVALLEIYDLQ